MLQFFRAVIHLHRFLLLFFFNDPATTEIYTLSLHDALPIFGVMRHLAVRPSTGFNEQFPGFGEFACMKKADRLLERFQLDRKSTRLNSSHMSISYAVFCLKKKKKIKIVYTLII